MMRTHVKKHTDGMHFDVCGLVLW